jgi:hypothetical protein
VIEKKVTQNWMSKAIRFTTPACLENQKDRASLLLMANPVSLPSIYLTFP